MSRRIAHRKVGRRRLLTPEVEKVLISAVRAGAPMYDAAGAAGISVRAFERWRQRGREELEARDEGATPDVEEEVFVELFQKLELAVSQARVRAVTNLQKAAHGGVVTEETTKRYRDMDGNMVEETTIKRTPPDWRASAFILERTHRTVWGKREELALTGADGGPVVVEHTVDTTSLATRIAESLAIAAAGSLPELTAAAETIVIEADNG